MFVTMGAAVACGSAPDAPTEKVGSVQAQALTVGAQLTAQGFGLDPSEAPRTVTKDGQTATGTLYRHADGRAAVLMRIEASGLEHAVIFDPNSQKVLSQVAPIAAGGAKGSIGGALKPTDYAYTACDFAADCGAACDQWAWVEAIFLPWWVVNELLAECYQECVAEEGPYPPCS
jgi:hypothetical protein